MRGLLAQPETLAEEGIEATRQALAEPDRFILAGSSEPPVAFGDYLLVRTYRIDDVTETPLMAITEWFLPALIPFLPGHTRIQHRQRYVTERGGPAEQVKALEDEAEHMIAHACQFVL